MVEVQTMLVDFEPMIAGKTENEILSMQYWERNPWYQKISKEEKEKVMRMLGTAKYGGKKPPEVGAKISAAKIEFFKDPRNIARISGENSPSWKGGISSKPYCPLFNNEIKEHIRNLCDRTCTICGRSTLQNIGKNGEWLGRLAIDHLDENKMQGCDGWKWRLTALCPSCHNAMNAKEVPQHLLLRLLLLNNKGHQTNFLIRR